jgi:hypothetical protein
VSDTYSVIPEPQHRAKCKTCLDEGYVEVEDCTCGAPTPWGVPGVGHDEECGWEPCPEGCGDE